MGDLVSAGVEGLASLVAPAADAAGAAAPAAGTGIGDIVGTGAGLFGGTTGLEGTALAGGFGGGLDALTATAGLGAAGTAADFLAAPGATGLAAGATTPIGGAAADAAAAQAASSGQATGIADLVPGGGPGPLGAVVPPPQPTALGGVTNATNLTGTGTSLPGGSTGLSGTSGVGATPSAIPSAGGAAGLAGPTGAAPVDATSAAASGAGAGAGATPAAAAPASSIDQLLKGAGDSITKNPLGIALGAGGLGYNIWQGQKNTQNQDALKADANAATANSNQMVASGEALQQYLTNGTLPPAYQTQVDQAIKDAKTTAISNAAQQGQNTDPTQNTALAATLAKIDASKPGMQTQVASQLFASGSSLVQSGATAAGLSGQLFRPWSKNDTTQAANTGKAIATLAAAMNGKTNVSAGGVNINTG